jgi:hypothetical protein
MLLLQARDLLSWYHALLLIAIVTAAEFFFVSYRRV